MLACRWSAAAEDQDNRGASGAPTRRQFQYVSRPGPPRTAAAAARREDVASARTGAARDRASVQSSALAAMNASLTGEGVQPSDSPRLKGQLRPLLILVIVSKSHC